MCWHQQSLLRCRLPRWLRPIQPQETLGFGYDPVFVPTGGTATFAELDPAEKHRISHRADAFAKLVAEQFS